jgi:hypothetical protein
MSLNLACSSKPVREQPINYLQLNLKFASYKAKKDQSAETADIVNEQITFLITPLTLTWNISL